MTTYSQIHLALYSLGPFTLLALANMLIIAKLYVKKKRVSPAGGGEQHAKTQSATQKSKFDKMSKVVILITLSFIGLTLPTACCTFSFTWLLGKSWGKCLIVFLDCLSFSYHALNAVISYFSNNIYKQEVDIVLGIAKAK
jgi:hypothetical protein